LLDPLHNQLTISFIVSPLLDIRIHTIHFSLSLVHTQLTIYILIANIYTLIPKTLSIVGEHHIFLLDSLELRRSPFRIKIIS